jgi:Fe2+ transport system protein FeoA
LNESSAALVRMFQEGAKFERMIKRNRKAVVEDKRAALIARNKLTTVGMLKSTKLTMILEQGKAKNKLISIKTNDVKPVGELTSVEIEGMKAEELAKMIKIKQLLLLNTCNYCCSKSRKNSMGLAEISKLTRGFKASDLMGTNKIHIGTTFRDDIIAPFQSRGVRNMPGLQESLNRTTLQPRTDSSDSLLILK